MVNKNPPKLNPGDTVKIIAPASYSKKNPINFEVVSMFGKKLGVTLEFADNVNKKYGYFFGSQDDNIAAIHQAYSEPNIKAIVALCGGYGSARLLKHLDYQLIKANPKILIGYSDITCLLNAITTKAGVITYHGPNAGSEINGNTLNSIKNILFKTPSFSYNTDNKEGFNQLYPGVAQGQLFGGNLTVFNSLLGTKFLPRNWQDIILFFEDVNEDVYKIDRLLGQLDNCGILEQVQGLVFGQFLKITMQLENSFTLKQVLQRYCAKYKKPSFMGCCFGHCAHNYGLPIGAKMILDANLCALSS